MVFRYVIPYCVFLYFTKCKLHVLEQTEIDLVKRLIVQY